MELIQLSWRSFILIAWQFCDWILLWSEWGVKSGNYAAGSTRSLIGLTCTLEVSKSSAEWHSRGLTWRRSAWEQQHADTAVTEAAGNPKRVWRLSHFIHAALSFSTLLLRSLLQNFYSLFLLPCSNIKTFLNVLFELLIHEKKLSWCGFGWLSPISCFSMEF